MSEESNSNSETFWRRCSSCKKPIHFHASYFICSVSTCNGQRTGYVFCSIPCFERHLPGARHKDAGAIEKTAPATGGDVSVKEGLGGGAVQGNAPNKILVRPQGIQASATVSNQISNEVLVIASRLKEYIAARSEFNTSASVMNVLSDHLRQICDQGIESARTEGRKTVMDRDFEFLKRR